MLDRLPLPAEGCDVSDEGVHRSHPGRGPQMFHARGHIHHRFGEGDGGVLIEPLRRLRRAIDIVEQIAQRSEYCIVRRAFSTNHSSDATGERFAHPLGFECV
ncbi:MAG: hypothetical protein NVS3B12_09780 [Acidimicrobiales bacterium]